MPCRPFFFLVVNGVWGFWLSIDEFACRVRVWDLGFEGSGLRLTFPSMNSFVMFGQKNLCLIVHGLSMCGTPSPPTGCI